MVLGRLCLGVLFQLHPRASSSGSLLLSPSARSLSPSRFRIRNYLVEAARRYLLSRIPETLMPPAKPRSLLFKTRPHEITIPPYIGKTFAGPLKLGPIALWPSTPLPRTSGSLVSP